VGLLGKDRINAFVLGVINGFKISGVNLKPSSSHVLAGTEIPPISSTIGEYDTKHGSGTIISSPGLTRARRAISIASEPPTVIIISLIGS
jgi:hypothetical protein